DFTAAATTFARYTQAFPDDAAGWANLAECNFALDRFAAGRGLAARAVARDPALAGELAGSRIARGDQLQASGQISQAADHYAAALGPATARARQLEKE